VCEFFHTAVDATGKPIFTDNTQAERDKMADSYQLAVTAFLQSYRDAFGERCAIFADFALPELHSCLQTSAGYLARASAGLLKPDRAFSLSVLFVRRIAGWYIHELSNHVHEQIRRMGPLPLWSTQAAEKAHSDFHRCLSVRL
jgi:hypothetical protein